MVGDRFQPRVVFVVVIAARGQQLDHRPHGTPVGQHGSGIMPVSGGIREAATEVVVQDPGDRRHVLVEIPDIGVAGDHSVGDGLGDLGLAASRDGGRLVAVGGPRGGSD